MGKKSKTGKNLASPGLLLFAYRHRAPLITITATALIVSVIVSLLITPRYRSTVIMYPASFTSMSRSLMGPAATRGEMASFGQEQDAERILQVLQSESVRELITGRYNLMEHYGIDLSGRYPYTALGKKYSNNVRFRKTQYMAIEIEVLDTDPGIAAAMANDLAGSVDTIVNAMLKERAAQALEIAREEYGRLNREIEVLQDSLRILGRMGVVDYEAQSEVLSTAYANAVLNNDQESIRYFASRLQTLTDHGATYISLRDNLTLLNERLGDLKAAYDEARINASRNVSYKMVIDSASIAEKKSYPVRWLIVAASTLSAFLFTLFFLLLADAVKRQLLPMIR
jgi:uncharacterized protein involved in exopolysaccharide biosynthesis